MTLAGGPPPYCALATGLPRRATALTARAHMNWCLVLFMIISSPYNRLLSEVRGKYRELIRHVLTSESAIRRGTGSPANCAFRGQDMPNEFSVFATHLGKKPV